MIESLDKKAWSALSATVAAQLADAYDRGSKALGPEGAKMAAKSRSKLSLSNSASVQDVANIVALLDASGQTATAVEAATVLRQIPFTGNVTIFEPVRQSYALVYRRLTLDGSPDAAQWEPLLSFAENGGEPGPIVIRDATANRLKGVLLRHRWQADMSSGSKAAHAANVCSELRELATMWALGGSETWPRPAIDEEFARDVEALRALGALPGA